MKKYLHAVIRIKVIHRVDGVQQKILLWMQMEIGFLVIVTGPPANVKLVRFYSS